MRHLNFNWKSALILAVGTVLLTGLVIVFRPLVGAARQVSAFENRRDPSPSGEGEMRVVPFNMGRLPGSTTTKHTAQILNEFGRQATIKDVTSTKRFLGQRD